MTTNPYRVVVIVDRHFGEQLASLAPAVPVWIVDTAVNRVVAQRLWTERPRESHLTGITTFKAQDSSPAEDLRLNEMETIDLHHGPYSADPPYTVLEVIGTPLSDRIKAQLSEYGFDEFRTGASGFTAVRPLSLN